MEISGKLFKLLGLCLFGGAGSCAILVPSLSSNSSTKKPEKVVELTKEEKEQQRKKEDREKKSKFMYKLSQKVFRFLKDKKRGDADKHEHVIKWLKNKFNSSLENEENTLENFKFLCKEQESKETKVGPDVEKEEFRLCFIETYFPMDLTKSKGNFHLWKDSEEYKDLGFDKWNSNLINIKIYSVGGGETSIRTDEEFEEWYKKYLDWDNTKQTGTKIWNFFATELDKWLYKPGFRIEFI